MSNTGHPLHRPIDPEENKIVTIPLVSAADYAEMTLWSGGDISVGGRVVSIDLNDDGTVEMRENCDQHFYAIFNKEQFGKFIEACKELHQKMK